MITVKAFPFNAFQMNTYVISNESNTCMIIDPGCSNENENQLLYNYIEDNFLQPKLIIYTHGHIDHILGTKEVAKHYNIKVVAHKDVKQILDNAENSAMMFGFEFSGPIYPDQTLKDGEEISLGDQKLKILYTPGHADGSICIANDDQKFVIVGDVLFKDSIGRTDLPTGDYDVLMDSINQKLFSLDDSYTVYPGHGPSTTIGYEKINNPFVKIN